MTLVSLLDRCSSVWLCSDCCIDISLLRVCFLYAGILDNDGGSALEKVPLCVGDVDISLCLIKAGCRGDKERVKVLCRACCLGRLDVVKELVEQHKVDPSECVNMADLYYIATDF